MGTPVRSATPERLDPEQRFSVADPGKEWRRGHRIPVVPSFDGYRAYAILGVVLFHIFQISGVFAAVGDSAIGVLFWGVLPRSLDVLFIVSGFVIYLPTVVRDGDFGRVSAFAVRRVRDLPDPLRGHLVPAPRVLAARRRKCRSGARLERDRVPGVDWLCVPFCPLPRTSGPQMGASLRATRPGCRRGDDNRWSWLACPPSSP
jgi:hypothetical protein